MSEPTAPPHPSAARSRAFVNALGELRRTAPETRGVLAGLLLVLGAWIGPGLAVEAPAVPAVEAIADRETGANPEVGGDAYAAAVRTPAVEDEATGDPRPTDED